MVQGVGETENPRSRLLKYLTDIRDPAEPTHGVCAITRHFRDPEHTVDDLEFLLVDKVSPLANFHPAVITPIRLRLEWLWIRRLDASLNIRRNWRASFPGGGASRGHTPQVDWLT